MKLWYSKTSPVVRKVMSVAHYHQLANEIELLETNSFSADSGHNKNNPIGKIPALETRTHEWIFDSRVIAEYLDSIGSKPSLYLNNDKRWFDLTLQALADGMLENIVPIVSEKLLRKDGHTWQERQDQFRARTNSALAHGDAIAKNLSYDLTIGTLALTSIADFALMRQELIGIDAQKTAPTLCAWAQKMNEQHECLSKTHPDNL